MLVGNKLDKEDKRKVSKKAAKAKALEYAAIFKEVSAKTGENIIDIFRSISVDVIDDGEIILDGPPDIKLTKNTHLAVPGKQKKKRKCC